MSYYLKKNEQKFDIVEKDTNTVIKLKYNEPLARETCRKLNLGSGFNGNTPQFFANFSKNRS